MGKGGRAKRAFVHPPASVGEARGVAPEHLHIGHQVVAEGDWLGGLQVGEAGHQRLGVGLGLGQQRPLQAAQLLQRAVAGLTHPQTEVEGDLVVAAASGVQPPRHRSDQLGEPGLHVHVDVLEFVAEREGALGHLAADHLQALLDGGLVLA
jgi:hypothetical protein